MKRLIILALLLCGLASAQEIKRPTATYSLPACVTACDIRDADLVLPFFYDAAGLSTSSTRTLTADAPGTSTHESSVGLTTWQASSGSYSSFVLKVNSTCTQTNGAACYIDYSTDGGSTWTSLEAGVWTNHTTTSSTIPGSVALSQLRVRVYLVATDGPTIGTRGTSTITGYDVWTDGILAGRRGQVIGSE